jgi:hypothetical protein
LKPFDTSVETANGFMSPPGMNEMVVQEVVALAPLYEKNGNRSE